MRVLFFNYEYPPLGGGAGNATYYILREFSKIPDLKLDLVTSSVDNQCHLEKIGKNISIHRLPIGKNKRNLHFQSQKDLLIYAWKAYWFARKILKNNKYDLSHSFFTVPCGFISLLLKKQYKIPYIVSLRGADVPGYSERFTFAYSVLKPLIKIIWKNASAVVSNSQGLKELALKTDSKQNIDIVYNGIDTEEFSPVAVRPLRNDFKIICVSRITARKGIKYLIEAVSKLVANSSDVKLEIIGEGDEKVNLENLVKELQLEKFVTFLGLVDHKKLPELYRQADIFVLPSLNEGMSNTILEAIASGLPIIATDTGGTKELVREGENGYIVQMKNSDDIAEKIKLLINGKNLRENMSQKSREIAEQMSWKKSAKQYFDFYKSISR
ncbi:MAG: hypothetical protein A3J63_01335 [Candidatus Moranbacteria bacterium RIFCSPHIGHO2_02_FULL_40_12b]|nr:MAG: hypothetical protein A3J63_01335 [Candidatus Moranbacteria bacterium RIFCSPHIGHO2_02_FULL_40_12b]